MSFSRVFSGHVDTHDISRAMSSLGWGRQRNVSIFVFASFASYQRKVYHFLPNDMSLLITSVLSPLYLLFILIIRFYNEMKLYRMNFNLL